MNLNYWKTSIGADDIKVPMNITPTLPQLWSRYLCCAFMGMAFVFARVGAEGPEITYEGNFPVNATAGYLMDPPVSEGPGYVITEVAVTGERDAAYGLDKWNDWEAWLLSSPVSSNQLDQFQANLVKALQEEGYVFATVNYREALLSEGLLVVKVQTGQQGAVTVKGNKNYTAEQVLEFVEWETGDEFNYNKLFENLYRANSRAHLEVASNIKPRNVGEGKRVVDVELTVKERYPVNVAWRFENTGIRETSDWRSRLQTQWSNPFKQDGVLAASWTTDPTEIDTVNAWNSSYTIPLGNVRLAVFGAYSESNVNDTLPELDIFGKGWYAGAQVIGDLIDTDEFIISGTLGHTYFSSETQSALAGTTFPNRRENMSMPRLSVSYLPKTNDWLGGKTFITNTLMGNAAGFLGASEEGNFRLKDGNSDGTFLLNILQMSRLQKLSSDPNATGAWSLFMDFNGQFTNETLPGGLQKPIGGQRTARGYRERIARGDYGFDATIELRTPLLTNFVTGLKQDEDYLRKHPHYWGQHRLQFVSFIDGAKTIFRNPQPGETESTDLFSVGVGLRAGLTKYGQLSFDYGYPLKSIRGTNNQGRAHVALELLY